ncbi:uncharacterized protein FOMMEDRAFT_149756 [Fomitiporia mediterranea MF3/22]|uniref:uncharacterized protein n=1 Tax=Fomitiporia mediterranea (strain MF3/22) TaxID=694068 RepID=UPI00044078CD|nr:uncharacterized protein FOMMEDRAFT_149756 [Fomitiporia mediterranea MF3/22]EJD07245.1 hypothetical protein FOMMEDRAFT_149756 [Fomitiporia mediterranea MF3/22]
MGPRNFLNLRVLSSRSGCENADVHLESQSIQQVQQVQQTENQQQQRPKKRRGRSYKWSRIPMLLMLGYASQDAQRRYERDRDWKRLYAILMFKIENITIVSGLLLASSSNLLIAGDLRRMTHASVSASIFGSTFSILFGLLCRINITSGRLEFLVTRTRLFYYLYSTPSLWGGAAALAFFVAVCAFTWLEESTVQYGWEAKTAAVVLSGMLIVNAVICFVLGASVMEMRADGMGEKLEEEQERKEEREREDEAHEREQREAGFINEIEQRNRRPRMTPGYSGDTVVGALGFSSFGILAWGADRQWMSSGNGETTSSEPSTAPERAATFDPAIGPRSPRRAYIRRQSQW